MVAGARRIIKWKEVKARCWVICFHLERESQRLLASL